MKTLDREEISLTDLEHLERLVTEDDLLAFDEECVIHDSCRPIARAG
jgi:hypothetical protein